MNTEKAIHNLKLRGYSVQHFATGAEAAAYLADAVKNTTVGIGGCMTAKELGLRYASEIFADRAYEEDGSLVNRKKPGAMIEDEEEAIARVVRMIKEGKVTAITGRDIPVKADSICVHGDGPKALAFTSRIRQKLAEEGITLAPFHTFIS